MNDVANRAILPDGTYVVVGPMLFVRVVVARGRVIAEGTDDRMKRLVGIGAVAFCNYVQAHGWLLEDTSRMRVPVKDRADAICRHKRKAKTPRHLPRTRAECKDGLRPCPYVSCRHHTYLDVNPQNGKLIINWPHHEPTGLEESCSLDVAERGEITHDEIGSVLNCTRQRVQQIEAIAIQKLRNLFNYAEAAADSDDEEGQA